MVLRQWKLKPSSCPAPAGNKWAQARALNLLYWSGDSTFIRPYTGLYSTLPFWLIYVFTAAFPSYLSSRFKRMLSSFRFVPFLCVEQERTVPPLSLGFYKRRPSASSHIRWMELEDWLRFPILWNCLLSPRTFFFSSTATNTIFFIREELKAPPLRATFWRFIWDCEWMPQWHYEDQLAFRFGRFTGITWNILGPSISLTLLFSGGRACSRRLHRPYYMVSKDHLDLAFFVPYLDLRDHNGYWLDFLLQVLYYGITWDSQRRIFPLLRLVIECLFPSSHIRSAGVQSIAASSNPSLRKPWWSESNLAGGHIMHPSLIDWLSGIIFLE